MSIGLPKFCITLDNPGKTFWPGETVNGHVAFELDKPKRINGLKIRCKGFARTNWDEKSGTGDDETTWHYGETENYFRMEVYVLGGPSEIESVEIEKGYHIFPFTFTLPHNIPSSYESFYGKVSYTIKATMVRSRKFNHNTEILLTVQSPYEISLIPQSQHPIVDERWQTFGCFPWNRSNMSVQIFVPVNSFAVGETTEARLTLQKKSSSIQVTRIKVHLEQNVTLYDKQRTKKEKNNILITEKLGPFNAKDVINLTLPIPFVPPTGFPNCRIIDGHYLLYFEIVVSGLHCNIRARYPITIGTRSGMNYELKQEAYVVPLQSGSAEKSLPL